MFFIDFSFVCVDLHRPFLMLWSIYSSHWLSPCGRRFGDIHQQIPNLVLGQRMTKVTEMEGKDVAT